MCFNVKRLNWIHQFRRTKMTELTRRAEDWSVCPARNQVNDWATNQPLADACNLRLNFLNETFHRLPRHNSCALPFCFCRVVAAPLLILISFQKLFWLSPKDVHVETDLAVLGQSSQLLRFKINFLLLSSQLNKTRCTFLTIFHLWLLRCDTN